MYGLVLFDDGVYHCTKSSNIKVRENGRCSAKWHSKWFDAKLLCSGSRELCLSIKNSLVFNVPRVEIVKIDLSSNNIGKDYCEKYGEIIRENDEKETNNEEEKSNHTNEKNSNEVNVPDLFIPEEPTDVSPEILVEALNHPVIILSNELLTPDGTIEIQRSQDIIEIEETGSDHNGENNNDITYENDKEIEQSKNYNEDSNEDNISEIEETGSDHNGENNNDITYENDKEIEQSKNYNEDSNEDNISEIEETGSDHNGENNNDITYENDKEIEQSKHYNEDSNEDNISEYSDENVNKQRRNATSLESTNTSFVDIQEIQNSHSKTKRYFCIYCKKLVTKFARHIETVHKDCFEVKKLLLLPKGCKQRQEEISLLRKKGSFEFNTKNAYNNGQLLVTRRPQIKLKKSANDYKVCPHCRGFYSKSGIRRHYIKCKEDVVVGEKTLSSKSRRVHGLVHKKADTILKDIIIPKLRDDDVARIIRYDELAIIYGNSLCRKYRKPHLHYFIRSKLRLIGRLMIEVKKINRAFTDFASLFEPLYYDDVVKGVNKVALLDESLNYKSPATAFSYGTLLKKCGQILINEHIKGDNEVAQKKVKNFLNLLQEDFANSVNKTVEENQLERKRQKNIILPSNEDVRLLNKYLNQNRKKYYTALRGECTESNWINLAEVTLTSVQVFNRRRAGEIERLSIADFNTHQTVDQDSNCDIFNSLSDESKKAARQYYRFEIRGKLARNVPVLLHLSHLKAIQLLIRHREEVGISGKNPYVFALPGGDDRILRACHLMRKFSVLCGAKTPATLRGTQLRKHIATQSILLDLEENEISDLANFMGHADKIHKDHYRLPIVTRDIVRMSRLLEKAQGSDELESIDRDPEVDESTLEDNLEGNALEEKSTERDSIENEFPLENNIEGSALEGMELDKTNGDCENDNVHGRKKRSVSPKGTVSRRSWSSPERNKVLKHFEKYIERDSLPSLEHCEEFLHENPIFKGRNSLQLKAWISNQIIKKKSDQIGKKRKRGATNYWSTEEKEIMRKVFGEHLNQKRLPSFPECREAINKYPELHMRNVQTVKAWVNNEMRRSTR